jgi:hypothetical protein
MIVGQRAQWASRWLVMTALGLAVASGSSAAWAQAPSGDAVKLFDEGKRLYEAKDFVRACEALQQSERLDPAVGTLGLLAACYEQLGKVATAYRTYVDAADRASAVRDSRERYARERAAALRPRLPVLTVHGDPSVAGLVVTSDGKNIGLGAPGFVDPGPHRIEASAPGRKPWTAEVVAKEGAPLDVQVPALELAPAESSAPRLAGGAGGVPTPPPTDRDQAAEPSSSLQTTLGWVTVGVGAAGIAFGAVTGVLALSKKSDLDEDPDCPEHCDDSNAVDSYNTVRVMSGVGLIAGSSLAVVGAVLLLTAPSPTRGATARSREHARRRVVVSPYGLIGASLAAPF